MRVLATAIVVAVLAAACTNSQPIPAETTALTSPFTGSPAATERLLAELDLEALSRPVSRLRELDFLELVPVQIIEGGDYRRRVNELTAAALEITPDLQSSWLRLLGMLPEGSNTYAATSRLLQTTVAFYDHEAGRILVREGAGVDPYVESVVVHELVHALQHQHFGMADTRFLDGDLGYVYSSIVEGDAHRITRQFIGELSPSDEFAYEEGRLGAAEDAIAIRDSTPPYVFHSLSQPATDGVRFLQGMSFSRVDGYLADLDGLSSLPQTSEEVLLPGADLDLPEISLRPVTVLPYQPLPIEGTLGAGRLRLILQQAVTGDLLGAAIVGWGADAVDIRVAGDEVIFAYLFRGEGVEDAQELAAAFRLLLETTLIDGAYGSVRVNGPETLILAASDPSVRGRLDELFTEFGDEVFATG